MGEWVEPTWKNSPLQDGFPVLDQDINVKLRPRHANSKWHVTFSVSEKTMEIVSGDFMATENYSPLMDRIVSIHMFC